MKGFDSKALNEIGIINIRPNRNTTDANGAQHSGSRCQRVYIEGS